MLLASSWPREAERVEHHLQREAHRDADQQLLRDHDEARGRERRDGRRAASAARPAASSRRRARGAMRAGTNRAPNTGATMRQAPMRTNGQKHCATQRFELPGGERDHVATSESADQSRDALDELARVARPAS